MSGFFRHDNHRETEDRDFTPCLNLLKEATYTDDEIKPDPDFNNRIIRRHRVHHKKRSWNALLPAVIGATTAAVGFLAIIQILAQPALTDKVELVNQKAELEENRFPAIPDLSEQ